MPNIARYCWNTGAGKMRDILRVPAEMDGRKKNVSQKHADDPDERQRNHVHGNEAVAFGRDAPAGAAEHQRPEENERHHHSEQISNDNRSFVADRRGQQVTAEKIDSRRKAASSEEKHDLNNRMASLGLHRW